MAASSICGVIITTNRMDEMVDYYQKALGLTLEREEHGDLDIHYGCNFGNHVHFALHPPADFNETKAGTASVKVAFTIGNLEETLAQMKEFGHEPVIGPKDEGFGPVAVFRDPDGNLLELVELNYDFEK